MSNDDEKPPTDKTSESEEGCVDVTEEQKTDDFEDALDNSAGSEPADASLAEDGGGDETRVKEEGDGADGSAEVPETLGDGDDGEEETAHVLEVLEGGQATPEEEDVSTDAATQGTPPPPQDGDVETEPGNEEESFPEAGNAETEKENEDEAKKESEDVIEKENQDEAEKENECETEKEDDIEKKTDDEIEKETEDKAEQENEMNEDKKDNEDGAENEDGPDAEEVPDEIEGQDPGNVEQKVDAVADKEDADEDGAGTVANDANDGDEEKVEHGESAQVGDDVKDACTDGLDIREDDPKDDETEGNTEEQADNVEDVESGQAGDDDGAPAAAEVEEKEEGQEEATDASFMSRIVRTAEKVKEAVSGLSQSHEASDEAPTETEDVEPPMTAVHIGQEELTIREMSPSETETEEKGTEEEVDAAPAEQAEAEADAATEGELESPVRSVVAHFGTSVERGRVGEVLRLAGLNPTLAQAEELAAELGGDGDEVCVAAATRAALAGGAMERHGEEELMDAFAVLDPDQHGIIAKARFEDVLTAKGEPLTAEELAEVMAIAAVDDDSNVDYRLFVQTICSA